MINQEVWSPDLRTMSEQYPKLKDEDWLAKQLAESPKVEVADALGCSITTVSKWAKRAGIGQECPDCGELHTHLNYHWGRSDCEHPEISDYRWELLTGVLMGDGCVQKREHNDSPQYCVRMISKDFLEWLSEELGWLGHDPYWDEEKEHNDMYRLNVVAHPRFEEFYSWYDSGRKRFPSGLNLTQTIAKMWYVTDGGLKLNERGINAAYIACTNEKDRQEQIIQMFRDVGFDPVFRHEEIHLNKQTGRFLDWIGSPPPGFSYKWEYESQSRYRERKEVEVGT